jgi:hypothetical protein
MLFLLFFLLLPRPAGYAVEVPEGREEDVVGAVLMEGEERPSFSSNG